MNDAELMKVILSRPIESLEVFSVVIADKLTVLRGNESVSNENRYRVEMVAETFAREGLALPPKQSAIRSNSATQRIKPIIIEFLKNNGPSKRKDVINHICQVTDIPKYRVDNLASASPQITKIIKRDGYGVWSLAQTE